MDKESRKNAFLYCKFRDEQFALYDEYAKSAGITLNTFLVLNVLYYAEEGMTQKEICARTFQSKQAVSAIVKKLQENGYVTVLEAAEDRRNKTVILTDTGRAYAAKPVRHITWAEDTAMSGFTYEEQKQLILMSRRFTELLTRLVRGNEDEE